MARVRILVVDPSPVVGEALRVLLHTQPDFEVVGLGHSAHDAQETATRLQPDVILLDTTLPDARGCTPIVRLRTGCPEARLVVLSWDDDPTHVRAVLAAGAVGYLVRRASATELFAAVWAAMNNRLFIDTGGGPLATNPLAHTPPALSVRETEVLRSLACGYSNQQTADRLSLSVKTVETYRQRIGQKLGLCSRPDFVRYALGAGLSLDDSTPS